ncbi:MAG: ABC transporter permease, partial [Oscillibacter sp.]|nr:ABC transporter permease [Oscillibacter sp.]
MKQTTLRRLISLALLLALGVLFTALSGSRFLNANNFIDIVRDASVTAIIGVGVTMAIITAGIDLSTGSIMAVVGMTMANIYAYTLWPIPVMILCGIVVGLGCGLINGYIIGQLHVPEFIGTLATMSIFRALTYMIAIRDANGVIQSQPMNISSYAVLGYAVG